MNQHPGIEDWRRQAQANVDAHAPYMGINRDAEPVRLDDKPLPRTSVVRRWLRKGLLAVGFWLIRKGGPM